MNNNVVPRNKLQQRFAENIQEHLAPDPFAVQQTSCVIEKVYDTETLSEEDVSSNLKALIRTHPGWLFALVVLRDGRSKMTLPFRDPEELIYTVYGNRVQLEGRPATICYVNQNPQDGCIIMQRTHNEAPLALSEASKVYDIGAII